MKSHYTFVHVTFVTEPAISVSFAVTEYPADEIPKAELQYVCKAKTAARHTAVDNAISVMRQDNGTAKVLQAGSGGFACILTEHVRAADHKPYERAMYKHRVQTEPQVARIGKAAREEGSHVSDDPVGAGRVRPSAVRPMTLTRLSRARSALLSNDLRGTFRVRIHCGASHA